MRLTSYPSTGLPVKLSQVAYLASQRTPLSTSSRKTNPAFHAHRAIANEMSRSISFGKTETGGGHHAGIAAVGREPGQGVDLVEHDPPVLLQEHVDARRDPRSRVPRRSTSPSARICSRCRCGQIRGNGDDRVLGALLRLGLLMDAEDAVPQRDLIHFPDDQVGAVAQHRAADLGADDRLLDQRPCRRTAVRPRSRRPARPRDSTLVTPNDEPERAGLTKTGYASSFGARRRRRRRGPRTSGVSIPALLRDDVRQRLVHADRRALDAAAHVGDPGQLEQALHRAVLTRSAVQDREHRVDVHRLAVAAVADEQSVGLPVRARSRLGGRPSSHPATAARTSSRRRLW